MSFARRERRFLRNLSRKLAHWHRRLLLLDRSENHALATLYVRHQNVVEFPIHPGVHEKRTLMNFERARKHSLITQFAIHVDTNIGLAVCIP